MTNDEDGAGALALFAAVRPADGGEQARCVGLGAEAFVGFERQAEGLGRLLRADGGADEDAQVLRGVRFQPLAHLSCLLFAARGEFALQVGRAFFGFGVAPEQEVHAGLRCQIAHRSRRMFQPRFQGGD